MSRPYAQRAQAPFECPDCDYYCVIGAWIERDDVYLDREECPECGAAIDLDLVSPDVTPIR